MNSPLNAYALLVAHLRRVQTLESVADLLSWDEQVNLPPAAAEQRAAQMAAMAEAAHAEASSPRAGEWIASLEADGADLGPDRHAVVREARRDYDRATRLPADFVREKAEQVSRAYHAWARAKAASDFASYAPVLEKNLDLARREADFMGWGQAPYDYFLDLHDPGLREPAVEALFSELKQGLVPLVRSIAGSTVRAPALAGSFPVEAQGRFLRQVTERLGFDYRRGRLDVSLHPFCSGSGDDVRMTTRFSPTDPLDSLFSSIHETGHGLYEQGLSAADRGTALGRHAGMAVHESQSRLWENQVARGRAFWVHFEPAFRQLFPGPMASVSSEAFHLAVNTVAPTPIRIESDEVSYNLHILLRFDIERRLFAGTLAVRDLPRAWNEATRELIGLTPGNDREGVLQDVHWSGVAFGYFPSYCLGNMIAAQLWYRALALRPALEEDFARGDFSWLLNWLRTEVHSQGRRHDALGLVRRVTGEPLSPRPLLRYLRERYGGLYLS